MVPPIVVLAASLVAAIVMLALAWLWPARPRGLACRWERRGGHPGTRLVRWSCRSCGVDAFCLGRRAPRECKRETSPRGL